MIEENNTFEEYKYAIYHKPTKKWVWFGNDDLELTVSNILLVDFKHCLINSSKGFLEMLLKSSAFNKIPNYGNENFLEFELVKVLTTYTIES
jgi:hypothetical protein